MWWWIVLAVLAVLLFAVLLSNVRIGAVYVREGENDEIDLSVRALFGLVRLRYKVPTVELKPFFRGIRLKVDEKDSKGSMPVIDFTREEIHNFILRVRELIQHMKNVRAFLAGTLQHIHVTEISWSTRFGVGDAAETGMTGGVVWGLKSAVIGYLSRWVTLERRPEIQVIPAFNQVEFRTDFRLESCVRVARLFVIGGMLFYRVLKRPGGWKVWVRELFLRSPDERPA